MQISKYLLFTSIFLISLAVRAQETLDPAEFNKQVTGKKVQLLDVRTPGEYSKGHLPNSMQADWNDKSEFTRRIQFLDKNAPVYVYCLSGGRSHAAAELLRKSGYSNVIELKGGITAWKAASLSVEQPASVADLSREEYEHMIGKTGVVLVDFGAPWCPPCRKMIPVVDEIEKKNPSVKVIRLNADETASVMKEMKVSALPTFIIYKKGIETWRKEGIATSSELKKNLN